LIQYCRNGEVFRESTDCERYEGDIARCVPVREFHRRDGTPIKDSRKAWKNACKAAGVPGRIPHDFRRPAVRNLERAGAPPSSAMRLTGHKTEAVYRRYAIVSESDLSEAVSKLQAFKTSAVDTVFDTVAHKSVQSDPANIVEKVAVSP